jgi:hypothetical protein
MLHLFKLFKLYVMEQNQQMSPEELDAKKKEMLKYYKDSLPYLQAQIKYEAALAELDEIRVKRVRLQHEFAYLTQAPEPEEEMPKEAANPSSKKERKLKTE